MYRICEKIEGCDIELSEGNWEGGVDFGSGYIGINVCGAVSFIGKDRHCSGDLRVDMNCSEGVTRRHRSCVRGVFGEIGLRKV